MKKFSILFAVFLIFVPLVDAFAITETNGIQNAIAEASTDDLLVLRELIDAELDRRYEAIGSVRKNEMHYVLNTNSKRFHIPSCSSSKHMKETNKKDYTGTREELISFDYTPCGNCNP